MWAMITWLYLFYENSSTTQLHSSPYVYSISIKNLNRNYTTWQFAFSPLLSFTDFSVNRWNSFNFTAIQLLLNNNLPIFLSMDIKLFLIFWLSRTKLLWTLLCMSPSDIHLSFSRSTDTDKLLGDKARKPAPLPRKSELGSHVTVPTYTPPIVHKHSCGANFHQQWVLSDF